MEHYRLYLYDREGRFDSALGLECRGDAHALAMLKEHTLRHPLMELWNRGRLVASHGTNPLDARLAY
jgi:hypothetical protein